MKIIIINGCPSAGKTSIIKEMQARYPSPLLYMGIDLFWRMIPEQYIEHGAKADEGFTFVTTQDQDNNPVVQVKSGPFALHLDRTLAQTAACLADCGHDLAIDEILSDDTSLYNYVHAFKNHTVYFVGIVCDLTELEKREKNRGNRELGLARGAINLVHKHEQYYDLIVDSTHCNAADCAEKILDFIQKTAQPDGFEKLKRKLQ